MDSRIALIFQGTIKTDARVLREVISLSAYYNVDVFSSQVNEDDALLLPSNVRLIGYQLSEKWLHRNIFFEKQFSVLQTKIDAHGYCAIICIDYPTLYTGVLLKKKNPQLKLIYDSHEIYVETINQFFPKEGPRKVYGIPLIRFNQWWHHLTEKRLVQQVDLCVTVCQSLSDYFYQKWGKKVHVLRNCPSVEHVEHQLTDKISPEGVMGDKQKGDIVLLYQGDVNPGRGLFVMLEVMKQLPDNFKFYVLGDGMLLDKLQSTAEKEGLSNVFFLGRVPYKELLQYTQKADIGICLIEPINRSKELSLPNKLFEYMSAGVPFVSNNLPEPRILVEKYDCGVLVDISMVTEVVEKIKLIGSDLLIMNQLGGNGKAAFEKELNWEHEFQQFIKFANPLN